MISKAFTVLGAILLAISTTAHADDPAYYKLTEVEELTIYKEGETALRPTFSFETVAFGMINPGWGKRTSSFGEFGRHWFEMAVTPGLEGTLGLGGYGKLFGRCRDYRLR
jgi:hypothetical protein